MSWGTKTSDQHGDVCSRVCISCWVKDVVGEVKEKDERGKDEALSFSFEVEVGGGRGREEEEAKRAEGRKRW